MLDREQPKTQMKIDVSNRDSLLKMREDLDFLLKVVNSILEVSKDRTEFPEFPSNTTGSGGGSAGAPQQLVVTSERMRSIDAIPAIVSTRVQKPVVPSPADLFELMPDAFTMTQVIDFAERFGIVESQARRIAEHWVSTGLATIAKQASGRSPTHYEKHRLP